MVPAETPESRLMMEAQAYFMEQVCRMRLHGAACHAGGL